MPRFAIPLSAIALAVFTHSLWGGNPVAVKFSLEWLPPLWTGFARFVLGVATVVIYARLRGIAIWPTAGEWRPLIILAIMFAVQITVTNFGYDMTSGAVAAVITSSYPLFAALSAHFYLQNDRLQPIKSLGLGIAFAGVALIILREFGFSSGSSGGDFTSLGPLVLLASAFLLGTRVIFAAKLVQSIDPLKLVIWQMVFSIPYFLIGALLFEEIKWQGFGVAPLAGILFQGIIISGFGFGFVVAITMAKYYNPSLITSFGFVSPLSGVLLAVWLLGDAITWQLIAGTAAVGLGLILITRKPAERAKG